MPEIIYFMTKLRKMKNFEQKLKHNTDVFENVVSRF